MKVDNRIKERTEPYINLNGLAKYLSSQAADQRERLARDFKYPDPDGYAQADYYSIARETIVEWHTSNNSADVADKWITYCESLLLNKISEEKAQKVGDNLRVVRAYTSKFKARKMQPLPVEAARLMIEGVQINLRPDMVALEGKRMRLVRFTFRKEGATPAEAKYSGQLLLAYARYSGLNNVKPSDCQLMVVADGRSIPANSPLKSFDAQLRGTLRELRRIWPEI